jgi:hypothetical protein
VYPALHTLHDKAPSAEKLPATQGTNVAADVATTGHEKPPGHAVHAADPASEYVPAMHASDVGDVAATPQRYPAEQLEHADAPPAVVLCTAKQPAVVLCTAKQPAVVLCTAK